ncbi:MAG: hypothetical protein U9N44_04030 [Chloroflexota bacterium]|nr:hypothetical protein [Chloroflexota bacterium]
MKGFRTPSWKRMKDIRNTAAIKSRADDKKTIRPGKKKKKG